MVRSTRLLEIIESEGLIEAAGPKGEHLVAGLWALAGRTAGAADQRPRPRPDGRASTCPTGTGETRCWPTCATTSTCWPCPAANRAIRFRPALSVTTAELDEAVAALGRSL